MGRLEERTVITAKEAGSILIERQMGSGVSWTTIDRYNTHNLAQLPKRQAPWIKEVVTLCSQPSAGINIVVPEIPALEPTTEDRLIAAYERLAELAPPPVPEFVDDLTRCAACGWPLAESVDKGCVVSSCSMRPIPEIKYSPERYANERRGQSWTHVELDGEPQKEAEEILPSEY